MNRFLLFFLFCLQQNLSLGQTTILSENFNTGFNNWTAVNISDASDVWSATNGYLQINGYGGSNDEDWLISPLVNLSSNTKKYLLFDYNDGFSGNLIELYYSTDFNGGSTSSAVQNATWTNIPLKVLDISATSCFSFLFQRHPAIDLTNINNSTVYFAFKYTGATFSAKQYRIDNFHIESDYYNGIETYLNNGGDCAGLKTQLCHLLQQDIEVIGYSDTIYDVWDASLVTDRRWNDAGNTEIVWDMFTDKPFTTGEFEFDHCSDRDNGSCNNVEGNCYNREHTFPRSWWGGTTVYPFDTINFDMHHVVPSDKNMNYAKFNYPPGIVTAASTTGTNGFKVGTNPSYPCSSMNYFEPIDAYKGDYARMFFYIATRYEYDIAGWFGSNSNGDCALNGNSYPGYANWMIDVLLDWHENDSVSLKERARNNAVYAIQGNRNPFIDHPEWVGFIWGDAAGNSCSQLAGCTLSTGVDVQSSCDNYTWIDGITYSSSNNTASYTLVGAAANGCDSIVSLQLSILSIDNSLSQNATSLTSNQANANYQWLDCTNNYAPINGANSALFNPSTNGNYAVAIDYNSCLDTSNCISITTLSTIKIGQSGVKIYPIPAYEQLFLEASGLNEPIQLRIYSTFGQLMQQRIIDQPTTIINLKDFASGLYTIELLQSETVYYATFIKV